MKTNLIIMLFAISAPFIFSSCYDCYSCLKNGESMDLPYSSDESIVFFNDPQESKTLIAQTSIDKPPEEYCGPIGSGSHWVCTGSASALLKENPDSNAIITIMYSANSYSHDVEKSVIKSVSILNSSISFGSGLIETNDVYGSAEKIESIIINGKQYANVWVYENDSVDINECSYFVYSMSSGVLKFSIKLDDKIDSWVLKN